MVWNLMFVRLTGDHSKYIYFIICTYCYSNCLLSVAFFVIHLIPIEFTVITRVVFVASMYLFFRFFVLVTIRS